MAQRFKVGDRVTWNSEAGHFSGTIIKVHTRDVNYKGYTSRERGRSAVRNPQQQDRSHYSAQRLSARKAARLGGPGVDA
jgi:hypothetical protein